MGRVLRLKMVCATMLAAAFLWGVLVPAPAKAVNLGGVLKFAKSDKTDKADNKGSSDSILNLPPYKGPRKRLGVMDMDVKITAAATTEPTATGGTSSTTTITIPPPTDFGTGLTEMLTTTLVNTGRFVVLERKALADIQAEQALAAGGSVDPASAAQAGKLLGAQALIRGAVTEYSYKRSSGAGGITFLKGISLAASKAEAMVALDIRIYDVATGQILDSVRAEGKAKSSATAVDIDKAAFKMSAAKFNQTPLGAAVRQAIDRAVKFIIDRMETVSWEGRVAEIDPDDGSPIETLYINAGSEMGLKVGDELEIIRPGKAIIDPETRTVIGRKKDTRLGCCRIVSVSKNLSTAELTEGDWCQVGDCVRLKGSATQPPKEQPPSTGNPSEPSAAN